MAITTFEPVTGKEQRIHVAQTGQKFHAEVKPAASPFNFSGFTTKDFKFKSPSGTTKTKAATEVGAPSGTSRTFQDDLGNDITYQVQLEYVVDDAALFDVAGTWTFWVETSSATEVHYGTATEFQVYTPGTV